MFWDKKLLFLDFYLIWIHSGSEGKHFETQVGNWVPKGTGYPITEQLQWVSITHNRTASRDLYPWMVQFVDFIVQIYQSFLSSPPPAPSHQLQPHTLVAATLTGVGVSLSPQTGCSFRAVLHGWTIEAVVFLCKTSKQSRKLWCNRIRDGLIDTDMM